MSAPKRIALYGGTFDPVHAGHVEVARKVAEVFEFARVVFIPAQVAPHKIGRPVTEPIHRYAMLALATQDDPRLLISTFELDAPDRRYTVDTVEHFQRELDPSTELFFIMGADSWSEITTWRDWERLLAMTNYIVVTRPGYEPTTTHVGELSRRGRHIGPGESESHREARPHQHDAPATHTLLHRSDSGTRNACVERVLQRVRGSTRDVFCRPATPAPADA